MEQLGIQPILLLAQIINFGIVLFVLTKLLYKPILSMLEKRKKEIAEGLALTQQLREESEKLEQKKSRVLDQARRDGHQLLDQAKKQAKEQAAEIVAKAHKDASAILDKAKKDAAGSALELQKDVRNQAVDLAVAMISRLLPGLLTADKQRDLVSRQLKDIKLASEN